jgi:hypothetical protein
MFLQNWYPRETSLLFTGRHMLCSMSVRKCICLCIPELQSWPEVKNTNMKFMKTQDKNTQISVYSPVCEHVKFPVFSDFSSKSLVLPQKLQEGNLEFSATFNILMRTHPASRWAQETFCCNLFYVTPFLSYIDWTINTYLCVFILCFHKLHICVFNFRSRL